MSKSKLGPIPDDHFENEPGQPGEFAGKWPPEQEQAFAAETARLQEIVRKKRERQGG